MDCENEIDKKPHIPFNLFHLIIVKQIKKGGVIYFPQKIIHIY